MQEILDLFEICSGEKDHKRIAISDVYEHYEEWFLDYHAGGQKYKKHLEGINENGLNDYEASLILGYSASVSSWLNGGLRSKDEITPCQKEYARLLERTLRKVKSANSKILYRMDWNNEPNGDFVYWCRTHLNSTFSIPCFLSTSFDNFENTDVVWEITTIGHSSNGKDISNIAQAPSEKEVLFLPNSTFKIKAVSKNGKIIYLEEINHDARPDFPNLNSF